MQELKCVYIWWFLSLSSIHNHAFIHRIKSCSPRYVNKDVCEINVEKREVHILTFVILKNRFYQLVFTYVCIFLVKAIKVNSLSWKIKMLFSMEIYKMAFSMTAITVYVSGR